MKNTISENEEACNTYNENIKEIINVDKKIKDKQKCNKNITNRECQYGKI